MARNPASVVIAVSLLAISVMAATGCGGKDGASQGISFADPGIEAAVRSATFKPEGPIYASDLGSLTKLSASGTEISDITDLRYFTNLTELHIWASRVSDISPLRSLTNLTRLSLESNEIEDIASLQDLTKLTELQLWSNRIIDISPLASLTNLTKLYLWNNRIEDVSPLQNLTKLTDLDLWGNEITDVSPLASLANLAKLSLAKNKISDISPLVENSGLGQGDEVQLLSNNLDLSKDSIGLGGGSEEDWRNVRALQDRGVTVSFDAVLNIIFPDENLGVVIKGALGKRPDENVTERELTKLTTLMAANKGIVDLTGIEYCTNVTGLHLGQNQISDVSLLASLTNLTWIHLEQNAISDISPMSSLVNLTNVHLFQNQISDISPLASLPRLNHVALAENMISDISSLAENRALSVGDFVFLGANDLDLWEGSDDAKDIRALRNRGVTVDHDEIAAGP